MKRLVFITLLSAWVFYSPVSNAYYGDGCSSYGVMAHEDVLTGKCKCSSGYVFGKNFLGKTTCISTNTVCNDKFGYNSKYDSYTGKCECSYGSEFTRKKYSDGYECKTCSSKYGLYSNYNSLTKHCECDKGYTLKEGKCEKKQNNAYFELLAINEDEDKIIVRSNYDYTKYLLEYNYGCYSMDRYKAENLVINLGTDFDIDTWDKIVLQDDDEVCDITSVEDTTKNSFEKNDTPSSDALILYSIYQEKCINNFGSGATASFGGDYSCYCKQGFEWNRNKTKCTLRSCKVKNSSRGDDGGCYCNSGYKISKDKNKCILETNKKENGTCNTGYILKNKKCISHTEDCKNFFGENTIGTKGAKENTSTCNCASSYKWNPTKTKCLTDSSKTNSSPAVSNNVGNKFSGKKCSADLTMSQNLRAPRKGQRYIRNGKYDSYTKGTVREANILQKHLNRLGFSAGKVDGIIGPNTRGAILRLQKYLGTKQDGYVGPKTRALLNNSCK